MPKSHKFTEEQKEEIKAAQKKNKNKVVDILSSVSIYTVVRIKTLEIKRE